MLDISPTAVLVAFTLSLLGVGLLIWNALRKHEVDPQAVADGEGIRRHVGGGIYLPHQFELLAISPKESKVRLFDLSPESLGLPGPKRVIDVNAECLTSELWFEDELRAARRKMNRRIKYYKSIKEQV